MTEIALNPDLDTGHFATLYQHRLRLQVPNILTDASAAALARCLERDVPWSFAYIDQEPVYLRAEELAGLSAAQQREILQKVHAGARAGFQYAYNCYPMLDAYLQGWNQVPLLDRMLEFLNSEGMLDFVRTVTGRADIVKGDAQATRYGKGQFLKFHTDNIESEYRVAAYVLNFTRQWDPDWGGYLQFYDDNWDIEQAFLPRFNALNIFTVPQRHSVSYVADFATGHRFAITGWFRYR